MFGLVDEPVEQPLVMELQMSHPPPSGAHNQTAEQAHQIFLRLLLAFAPQHPVNCFLGLLAQVAIVHMLVSRVLAEEFHCGTLEAAEHVPLGQPVSSHTTANALDTAGFIAGEILEEALVGQPQVGQQQVTAAKLVPADGTGLAGGPRDAKVM